MASREYRHLKAELDRIEQWLLPPVRPRGNYTARETQLMRAYILLVHSEIENYFETRCERIASRAKNNYPNRKTVAIRIALYFVKIEDTRLTTHERVYRGLSAYQGVIQKNDGIGKEGLLKLLRPLGIEEVQLDKPWLQVVDDFKIKRGEIAHKSRISMQKALDPQTITQEVQNIMWGVGGGILYIDRLLAKI